MKLGQILYHYIYGELEVTEINERYFKVKILTKEEDLHDDYKSQTGKIVAFRNDAFNVCVMDSYDKIGKEKPYAYTEYELKYDYKKCSKIYPKLVMKYGSR